MSVAVMANGCRDNGGRENSQASTSSSPKSALEITISTAEQAAQNIEVETAAMSDEPSSIRVPGKIVLPDNETWRVGVLAEGRVEHVFANLGDHVHKGEVLANMHSHDVHEGQAAFKTATAELTRLEAASALAQRNYDRTQRLYELKAASAIEVEQSRQELVNAQTALKNAETAVLAARTHLQDTLGVSPEALDAGGDADLMPIVAPASGYILQKDVTPGVTLNPADDAFVIGSLQRLWMLASASEDRLIQLKTGQAAEIILQGVPGERFPGKVVNLGQQFDPTTRLIPVRIEVNNSKGLLRPEMLASADILVGHPEPMLLISQDAVQQVNGEDVVFVRTYPDRFTVRAVRTDGLVHGRLKALEGLKPGEVVVTRGSFVVKSQLLRASIQGD